MIDWHYRNYSKMIKANKRKLKNIKWQGQDQSKPWFVKNLYFAHKGEIFGEGIDGTDGEIYSIHGFIRNQNFSTINEDVYF